MFESTEGQEQNANAEQRHANYYQAGDCAAAKCDLKRFIQAGARCTCRADIRTDRNIHTCKACDGRTESSNDERDHGDEGDAAVTIGKIIASEKNDSDYYGEHPNALILPAEEGLGPFADGIGDFLHVLGASIGGKDVTAEEDCYHKSEGGNYDGSIQPLSAIRGRGF